MKILALDTATYACSVALRRDGETSAHQFAEMPRGQSEALVPMVLEVMKAACAEFSDLDALAVTIGPGAFTGMRIGLSTARALALAADKPLIGITTLKAVAHNTQVAERGGREVLVVLDAKRKDVYAQTFDSRLQATGEPVAVLPEGLPGLLRGGPSLIVGDFSNQVLPIFTEAGLDAVLSSGAGLPDAAIVARLAEEAGLPFNPEPVAPLYIRPPDAAVPKNGGRLRP